MGHYQITLSIPINGIEMMSLYIDDIDDVIKTKVYKNMGITSRDKVVGFHDVFLPASGDVYQSMSSEIVDNEKQMDSQPLYESYA